MDLQFFGANCITIEGKGYRIVVDDNLIAHNGKMVTKDGDIVLSTSSDSLSIDGIIPKLVIDQPGEYEVNDVSIIGIASKSHLDEVGLGATIYKVLVNDLSVLVVGHIYPELSEQQLDMFGEIDAMIVPVGGNGYTLDAVGALNLIKRVEPKLVIPTHYADSSLKFEVPQQSLEHALKELGMEPKDRVAKLKLKASDLTNDVVQLVVLEKQ